MDSEYVSQTANTTTELLLGVENIQSVIGTTTDVILLSSTVLVAVYCLLLV